MYFLLQVNNEASRMDCVGPSNVLKMLKIPHSSTSNSLKRYDEVGRMPNGPNSDPMPPTATTSKNINRIRKRTDLNPEQTLD